MARVPRATIDFETRSACNLKRRGPWLYSKHATTQILCLRYRLPGMEKQKPKIWHRAHPALGIKESPPPTDLFDWIKSGGKLEAHSAAFEMDIWDNVAVPEHGWPKVKFEQWLCSAAKAAAHGLPRSLDGAINALNLPVKKDPVGERLIKTYSIPKKLTKEEIERHGADAIIFNEDADGLARTWEYCGQDVRAEEYFSASLPDLSPMEQRIWQITQKMNRRGIRIDAELARSALNLAAKAKAKANKELEKLTGISAGTQRQAVKKWLADYELVELPDTQAKTLEWFLKHEEMSPRAKRVIQIIKEVNRTSVNKYQRMLENIDDDERYRDLYAYCGAEKTGRFSARGVQIHNLPKGKFEFDTIDSAVEIIKTQNLELCERHFGDVMNVLSSSIRGAFIAGEGKDFLVADYSAIEARCVLWESGATAALEVFRQGGDIYCDMASAIFGREITKHNLTVINAAGKSERDFGKVAVLGLGYGMGFIKFLLTLRDYEIYLTREDVLKMMGRARLTKYEAIVLKKMYPRECDFDDPRKYKAAAREASVNRRRLTDEREDPQDVIHELALCKFTVDTYRSRYPEVKAMWRDQEDAAIQAVRTGKPVKAGVFTWYVKGRFLKCRLPSGRTLNYCDPEIKMAKTSWGEIRPSLRFMGLNSKKQWARQGTYGGKIVENQTQGTARDIMCFAMVELDDREEDFDLAISVHDELGAEVDEGTQDEKQFERLMATLPAVFATCPITAEATRYQRYRK